MAYRQMVASEAALIPLFLGKRCSNISFVLDSSESMRAVLGSVKQLLIQTLLSKASLRDSLFNIITFSNEVNCWSHHMLPCAPDTVYRALSWIHSICCSPGRDPLAALRLALTDPACHAIHLFTTDLLDQPEAVLRALPTLAAGRPVNVFYLRDSDDQLDSNTRQYLKCLSQATGGSCYVITDSLNGKLGKVIPLYVAESQSSVSLVKCCCPSSSVMMLQQHSASSPLLRCSLENPLLPVTSCVLSDRGACRGLGGSQFFAECRVLARREGDGLYYLGTVIQQVQDHTGVWVVEFDHPGSDSLGAVSSQRQLVCSLDMVSHIRDHKHCLVPGNTVLSPWEPGLKRHGPGRVMAATEHRGGHGVGDVRSLRLLMWNGRVSLVPESLVVPISPSHYNRIVRELQIPTSLPSQYCNWVSAARCSSCPPQLFCTDCSPSTPCCCFSTNHWPCMPPPSCRSSSSLGRMDGFEGEERDKQVDLKDTDVRKSDPEVSSSTSSSLSNDEIRLTSPPALKLRSKQQRPPWRYWRRTGPEPQQRQPGSLVPRGTAQPARFSFPVLQISASPNHSSLFQSLPVAKGRRASVREVFGATNFKPRPPEGLQPFSEDNATAVYT